MNAPSAANMEPTAPNASSQQQVLLKRVALVVLSLIAVGLAVALFWPSSGDAVEEQGGLLVESEETAHSHIQQASTDQPALQDPQDLQDSPTPPVQPPTTKIKAADSLLSSLKMAPQIALLITILTVIAVTAYLAYQMHVTSDQITGELLAEDDRRRAEELALEGAAAEAERGRLARERELAVEGVVGVVVFSVLALAGVGGVVAWWLGRPPFAVDLTNFKGKAKLGGLVAVGVVGVVGAVLFGVFFPVQSLF